MKLLIAMIFGMLLSLVLKGDKVRKSANFLQTVATLLLIFSMGYALGSRPGFLDEISEIGLQSLLYCIFPTAFSIIVVFILTKVFKKKGGSD